MVDTCGATEVHFGSALLFAQSNGGRIISLVGLEISQKPASWPRNPRGYSKGASSRTVMDKVLACRCALGSGKKTA